MEESVTYQAILRRGREEGRKDGREEGRVAEARAMILRLGSQKFGPPTAEQKAAVEDIADATQLERLMDKLLDVLSWADLLTSG